MAADSGMETCPSPEIADSRKRPLDCDVENGATKRSHYGTEFTTRSDKLKMIRYENEKKKKKKKKKEKVQ